MPRLCGSIGEPEQLQCWSAVLSICGRCISGQLSGHGRGSGFWPSVHGRSVYNNCKECNNGLYEDDDGQCDDHGERCSCDRGAIGGMHRSIDPGDITCGLHRWHVDQQPHVSSHGCVDYRCSMGRRYGYDSDYVYVNRRVHRYDSGDGEPVTGSDQRPLLGMCCGYGLRNRYTPGWSVDVVSNVDSHGRLSGRSSDGRTYRSSNDHLFAGIGLYSNQINDSNSGPRQDRGKPKYMYRQLYDVNRPDHRGSLEHHAHVSGDG